MKHLLTLTALLISSLAMAQNDPFWNPDANGDGAVGSADLLAFLTAYGESFVPPAAEDENWVECTAEDYVLLSDTIFPSDYAAVCDTGYFGCSSYSLYLDNQTDQTWWEYSDSLWLSGSMPGGRILHLITWPTTCNSVNVSTVRDQANQSSENGLFATYTLTPPDYSEGARLRLLVSSWVVLDKRFIGGIGLDIVHERPGLSCYECDSSITNIVMPNSNGFLNLGDQPSGHSLPLGVVDPNVLMVMSEAVLQNGVWFVE